MFLKEHFSYRIVNTTMGKYILYTPHNPPSQLAHMGEAFWRFWTRPAIQGKLHWKHSNGVIAALWAGALAMALAPLSASENFDYLFRFAYVLTVVAYLITIGAWLTSKTVEREGRLSRQQRRHGKELIRFKTYTGLALFTLLFAAFVWGTSGVKLHKQLQELAGRLFPGSDKTPTHSCGTLPKKALLLFFGESGDAVLVTEFPHTIVRETVKDPTSDCHAGCSVLSIDKDQNAEIFVKMDVRDKDNKIIVQLDEYINQHNYLRMNRADRNSLTVQDQEGIRVLDMRYLNAQALQIDGVLHVRGREIRLHRRGFANNCFSGNSAEFGEDFP